jgi:hypothetical protein
MASWKPQMAAHADTPADSTDTRRALRKTRDLIIAKIAAGRLGL